MEEFFFKSFACLCVCVSISELIEGFERVRATIFNVAFDSWHHPKWRLARIRVALALRSGKNTL